MKIDFSAVIKDLEGDVVKDGEKDATLGRVACTALLASYADEQNLAAEDKVRRFRLAEIAAKGGEQELRSTTWRSSRRSSARRSRRWWWGALTTSSSRRPPDPCVSGFCSTAPAR